MQKYTEAMVAGTLLIGDMPHDRMNAWRNFGVEVASNATNQQLLDTALWWLEHEEARLAKTRAGQAWARAATMVHQFWFHFNQAYYRVVSMESGWPQPAVVGERPLPTGFVGKRFPFPFYVRCRFAGGQKYCRGEEDQPTFKLPHFSARPHPSHGGKVPRLSDGDQGDVADRSAYRTNFRPLRWLLLQSSGPSELSLQFRMLLLGAEQHALVQHITVWGPGHPDYLKAWSLRKNLDEKFTAEYFDIVFYEADGRAELPSTLLELSEKSRTVTIATPGPDTHGSCLAGLDGRGCFSQLQLHRPRIVVLSSAFDLMQCCDSRAGKSMDEESLMVNVPAGMLSPPAIFHRPRLRDTVQPISSWRRPIDVLVIVPAAGVVPTWLTAVSSALRRMWNVERGADETPVIEHCAALGLNADNTTITAYAAKLRRAKVAVIHAPLQYFVREFADAMLSGTLVISDVPTDFADEFAHVAVPVDSDDLARVSERIHWWLRHETERDARAAEARAWVLHAMTTRNWFDVVTETYFEAISPPAGENLVGKKFSSPFHVGCRKDIAGKRANAWCQGEENKRNGGRKKRSHHALNLANKFW